MKPTPFMSCILVLSLAVSTPTVVFSHVGHGDEFHSEGGVQRVKVNPETDQMLGILVTPIKTADESDAVMVPVTALVDADGKQLVFVQYENFYEPVPVKTGATKGELIEVTEGLSVGEKLVTQGGLSLFAESRKTQTTTASPSPAATASSDSVASPQSDEAHALAHAQGKDHHHEGESAFPTKKYLAVAGGILVVLSGAIAFISTRKKKSIFPDKDS